MVELSNVGDATVLMMERISPVGKSNQMVTLCRILLIVA